jgi:hypothetical protein
VKSIKDIRARIDAIHQAKADGDHELLSTRLAEAQESALVDLAFALGWITGLEDERDYLRSEVARLVAERDALRRRLDMYERIKS